MSANARVVEAIGKRYLIAISVRRFDRQAALNDDGICSLSHHSRKGTFELVRSADQLPPAVFLALSVHQRAELRQAWLSRIQDLWRWPNTPTPSRRRQHVAE